MPGGGRYPEVALARALRLVEQQGYDRDQYSAIVLEKNAVLMVTDKKFLWSVGILGSIARMYLGTPLSVQARVTVIRGLFKGTLII